MNEIIDYLKKSMFKRYFENNNILSLIVLNKNKVVWKYGEDNIDLSTIETPIVYLSNCREFNKKYLKLGITPKNVTQYGNDLSYNVHIFTENFNGQEVKFIILTNFGRFIVHTFVDDNKTGKSEWYKDGKHVATLSL